MPNGEELEPFIKLRDEMAKAVEGTGATLVPQTFQIVPGEDRLSRHFVNCLFEIDPAALKSQEQRATDDAFNSMMMMEKQAEIDARKAAARERMLGHIKNGDILGTDDDNQFVVEEGTEGQDRESYTDTQDRDEYTVEDQVNARLDATADSIENMKPGHAFGQVGDNLADEIQRLLNQPGDTPEE